MDEDNKTENKTPLFIFKPETLNRLSKLKMRKQRQLKRLINHHPIFLNINIEKLIINE